MTNIQKQQTNSNDNTDSGNSFTNTMKSIRDLFGYDLHVSRVAFEHADNEIVLVNDLPSFARRIYVNGEQVFYRFSIISGHFSDTEFDVNGVSYRVISRVSNWLTMAQSVSLFCDGIEVGRTSDPMYGAGTLQEKLHVMFGYVAVGMITSVAVKAIF